MWLQLWVCQRLLFHSPTLSRVLNLLSAYWFHGSFLGRPSLYLSIYHFYPSLVVVPWLLLRSWTLMLLVCFCSPLLSISVDKLSFSITIMCLCLAYFRCKACSSIWGIKVSEIVHYRLWQDLWEPWSPTLHLCSATSSRSEGWWRVTKWVAWTTMHAWVCCH